MPAYRYMEENSTADILATKRITGVTPEVNLIEHVTHMSPLSMNKAAHSNLKPRGDVTRNPKQGYQCPHKKDLDLCPPKMF